MILKNTSFQQFLRIFEISRSFKIFEKNILLDRDVTWPQSIFENGP